LGLIFLKNFKQYFACSGKVLLFYSHFLTSTKVYNKSRKNRSPRYYIWGNEPLFHIPYDNSIISYINYNIIIKYFVNSKIAKPLFHETAEKRFVYSF